jgi:hypothetical protein
VCILHFFKNWGHAGDVAGLFCKSCKECTDRLFSNRGFSWRIWREFLGKILIKDPCISWKISEWGVKDLKSTYEGELLMPVKLGGCCLSIVDAKEQH